MPIDGGQQGKLAPGTRLTGKYKQAEYGAVVVDAEGGVRYRLDDGREFGSPSAAGTAVMGGIACNGWRFGSVVASSTRRKSAARRGASKRAVR